MLEKLRMQKKILIVKGHLDVLRCKPTALDLWDTSRCVDLRLIVSVAMQTERWQLHFVALLKWNPNGDERSSKTKQLRTTGKGRDFMLVCSTLG
jgi:hypothetical protein